MKDLKDVKFVNLDTKSTYSSPFGVGSIDEHVSQTILKGHSACCIADINSGASFYDLYVARKSPGKKTKKSLKEVGLDSQNTLFAATISYYDDTTYTKDDIEEVKKLIFSGDRRFNYKVNQNKDLSNKEDIEEVIKRSHYSNRYRSDSLIIIPINQEGFKNYCNIITETSYPENMIGRSSKRIPLSRLFEKSEGLIVILGGNKCSLKRMIEDGNDDGVCRFLSNFKDIFGDRLFYSISIQQNEYIYDQDSERYISRGDRADVQKLLNEYFIKNSPKDKIIIKQDASLPKKEFKVAQDVLIDSQKTSIPRFQEPLHLMSVEEMWDKASKCYEFDKGDFIQWCENTYDVASNGFSLEPDFDFKLPVTPVRAHFSNNPHEFTGEFREELSKMGLLEKDSDFLYFKIQALLRLAGESFDEKIKDIELGSFIDRVTTAKNKIKIQRSADYITSIEKRFGEDPKVSLVMSHAKENENIMTMMRSCIIKGKVDLENDNRRKEFFSELEVICCNGVIELSPYFLSFELASDLGRDINKTAGLGRGSGVGSVVNYALDITDAVPWEWDLLFERFLVPERIGVLYLNFKDHDPSEYSGLTNEDLAALDEILSKLSSVKIESDVKKNYEEELYFMRCNPFIARYFLDLLKDNFKSEENKQNSTIAYLLGLAPRPTGQVDRSTRSLPDIDFDANYKDEICNFFQKLYGVDYTCYIGTYSGLQVKSTCQALFRGVVPPNMVIKASQEFDKFKPLKNDDHEVIEDSLAYFLRVSHESPILSKIFKSKENLRSAAEYCLGNYLHMGIHAGGFINSPVKVIDYIPCNWDEGKGAYVSQLAKDEVEGSGFIKNDYLGLSTLTVIEHACEIINRNRSEEDALSLRKIIRTDCKDSLDSFARDTLGVFQFSGEAVTQGVTRIRDMKKIYIPFLTSVYRPGPMGANFHNMAIDLINGVKEEDLFDESLREILSPTKSLIAYQEQVMAITKKIGGFDGFEADKVRRAMGKKKLDVIKDFEKRFIDHAVENFSYTEKKAKELWGMLCNFAEYGFNKSHAVAYGLTSYACMWLKNHYPLEFKAATLNDACTSNSKNDIYKKYQLSWGSDIITPDINLSSYRYDVKDGKIAMPLFSIKNVGVASSMKISKISPFTSLKDLCYRGRFHKAITTKDLKGLTIAGALDCLKPDVSRIDNDTEGLFDLLDMMELEVPKKIKEKMSLGVDLSESEKASLKDLCGDISFIPTLKFRRYILKKNANLLALDFPKSREKSLPKRPMLSDLKAIAKKTNVDLDKVSKAEMEANSINLSKEQYKALDIQNFDIKGDNKKIIKAIDNVYMADDIFSIENKCQELISGFDKKMSESAKSRESLLPFMLSFYHEFTLLCPHYKVGEYITKRFSDNISSIDQARGIEAVIFEDAVNNRYFWKKEFNFNLPENLLGVSERFSSVFYKMSETDDGVLNTNLSHMTLACLYAFVIKNKALAIEWSKELGSRGVDDAISKLSQLSKDDVEDFKELVNILISKFKKNDSETKLTNKTDFSAATIDSIGLKNPLSRDEISIFNNPGIKVCGSVFKLPKKMRGGVRDLKDKKTGNMKTMFKFNLSNSGKQVLCITFDTIETSFSKLSCTEKHDGNVVVSRSDIDERVHDVLSDYDTVICTGSISYSINFDSRIQIVLSEVSKI
jgi:DNA polymerase III alpha subunit